MEEANSTQTKISYRLFFSKEGVAAYVSHLDVMRTFTRALKRANIPVWYTQGFTKRPYLDFPFPLPLGVVGENEIMDFAVTETIIDFERYKAQINDALPDGFCVNLITDELSDTSKVLYAKYSLSFPDNVNMELVDSFLTQETIIAEKFSKKKGTVKIDLVPMIKSAVFDKEAQTLDIVLPTGMNLNININVFINALSEYLQEKPEIICAKRTEFYPEISK
jgi:radical SAM-linked protein